MLETLDFAFYIGRTPTFVICISTLPMQDTMFISVFSQGVCLIYVIPCISDLGLKCYN